MAYGRNRKSKARSKAPTRSKRASRSTGYRTGGKRSASRKRAGRGATGGRAVKQQVVRLEIIQRPLEAAPAALPDTRKEVKPKRAKL